tara:strand:+ start:25 stop:441 length:417 start_codon:yes stop_codon:yes gene_type:complete
MKTLKEILQETSLEEKPIKPKKSPIQLRRAMGRRMERLAKKSSTKMKKKRALLRKRDSASLKKSADKQAKMIIIKKQLGPDLNYNELPIQKRIQIDQKVVAKKAKVLQKLSKKLLRGLKAKEGERVKKAKDALAQREG